MGSKWHLPKSPKYQTIGYLGFPRQEPYLWSLGRYLTVWYLDPQGQGLVLLKDALQRHGCSKLGSLGDGRRTTVRTGCWDGCMSHDQDFVYPDSWADPNSRSILEFCNLHHRSTSPELGDLLLGSSRGLSRKPKGLSWRSL